jgi:hypothetical protein
MQTAPLLQAALALEPLISGPTAAERGAT